MPYKVRPLCRGGGPLDGWSQRLILSTPWPAVSSFFSTGPFITFPLFPISNPTISDLAIGCESQLLLYQEIKDHPTTFSISSQYNLHIYSLSNYSLCFLYYYHRLLNVQIYIPPTFWISASILYFFFFLPFLFLLI